MISWVFLYLNVPWMSAVWFLVVDIFLILGMRDGILLFFNVFLKNKNVIEWQGNGVKIAKARQKKNLSIMFPLSAFLKIGDWEDMETQPEQVPALGADQDANIP